MLHHQVLWLCSSSVQAELDKLSTSTPHKDSLNGASSPPGSMQNHLGPLFVPIVLSMSMPDQALLAEEWHARQQVLLLCF